MKFVENRRRKKEIERDCENYFRNLIIKNLSDFNRYSEYLNNDRRINIIKKVVSIESAIVIAGLIVVIYLFLK
jgi:hypothetical protein